MKNRLFETRHYLSPAPTTLSDDTEKHNELMELTIKRSNAPTIEISDGRFKKHREAFAFAFAE